LISRRALLLATVASATLLNPLNSSMISVALPSLGDEFGLSFAGVTWLVSIFYLTSAVAQPVVGRLGDVYGKRRVFFCGLALVAASSLLAPFSPGFSWLVLARAAQAIGSSVFFPVGTGLIRELVTERRASRSGCSPSSPRSRRRWARRSAACWSTGAAGGSFSLSTCRSSPSPPCSRRSCCRAIPPGGWLPGGTLSSTCPAS
jgi:MFS family permease